MRSSWLVVFVLAGVLCGASSTHADEVGVQCALNDAPAIACRMSDSVAADGTHSMEFTFGTQHARFSGKSQTGWWSGQLDGQPAMGRELNRGHIVFSTIDLKTTFEWWSQGSEHGSY